MSSKSAGSPSGATRRKARLRLWLETRALPAFEGRILPVDVAVGWHAAQRHVPDLFPVNDAWIAATALVHGMTVVTRNIADFEATGISLLNPWGCFPILNREGKLRDTLSYPRIAFVAPKRATRTVALRWC
jgi:hypothetical protein